MSNKWDFPKQRIQRKRSFRQCVKRCLQGLQRLAVMIGIWPASGSQVDETVEVEHGLAGYEDPVLFEAAMHTSASSGDLSGGKFLLGEQICPVRSKRAVGRTGNRVFIDADSRRKKTADKVGMISACSDHYSPAFEFSKAAEIGPQFTHGPLVLEFHEIVDSLVAGHRLGPKRHDEFGWCFAGFDHAAWKVQRQPISFAQHTKGAAPGVELDLGGKGFGFIEQRVS